MRNSVSDVEHRLHQLRSLLEWSRPLAEGMVKEFFIEQHWHKVPHSWREPLLKLPLEELAELLVRPGLPSSGGVWPLSLLAFLQAVHALRLPGQLQPRGSEEAKGEEGGDGSTPIAAFVRATADGRCNDEAGVDTELRRAVKPKKMHEIVRLGAVADTAARHAACDAIVDVGSGQGYLSRALAFEYNWQVVAVEAVAGNVEAAGRIDVRVQRGLRHKLRGRDCRSQPTVGSVRHVAARLPSSVSAADFLRLLSSEERHAEGAANEEENAAEAGQGVPPSEPVQEPTGTSDSAGMLGAAEDAAARNSERGSSAKWPSAASAVSARVDSEKDKQRGVADLRQLVDREAAPEGSRRIRGPAPTAETHDAVSGVSDGGPVGGGGRTGEADGGRGVEAGALGSENDGVADDWAGGEANCGGCGEPKVASAAAVATAKGGVMPPSAPRRGALIGLHTCGDLAPTMLRVFDSAGSAVQAVVSVGCCYMHCTEELPPLPLGESRLPDASADAVSSAATSRTGQDCNGVGACAPCAASSGSAGYPMSAFVASLRLPVGYHLREMACHSLTAYAQRLSTAAQQGSKGIMALKLHCRRAVLELVLRKHAYHDGMRRAGVRAIKGAPQLPFDEYVAASFERLRLPPLGDGERAALLREYEPMLQQWKHVVAFYVLRLLLAPLWEEVILLDRLLFLAEQGYPAALVPLFDPLLSPRNYALIGLKDAHAGRWLASAARSDSTPAHEHRSQLRAKPEMVATSASLGGSAVRAEDVPAVPLLPHSLLSDDAIILRPSGACDPHATCAGSQSM